jgi:hypothetical protein
MKTVKDLRLLYKQETGLNVITNLIGEVEDDENYMKWLEQEAVKVLQARNSDKLNTK